MPKRNESTPARLRGRIERVYYAGPKFSAGRLLTPTGEEVQFAGNLFARENQPVVLLGTWSTHPKYGRQFKVDGMENDLELDPEGLVHYLANHPEIKGIGPAKARLIVETFGDAFEETLLKAPERITLAARLPKDSAQRLRDEWLKNRSVNTVMAWLSAFGLTHHQVTTLVEKLGGNCLDVLKEDPYILIREIRGFGFKKVDKIARKLGTPKDHTPRIRAGLNFCVREALDNGHCWNEYEDLVDQANLLLVMDALDSRVRVESALDALIDEHALACDSHGGRFVVALPEIVRMERELASLFGQAETPNPHFHSVKKLDALIRRCAATLNEKQLDAVRSALKHSISLISGGAGSGKSYTISVINTICEESDLEVVLAAPTGKAAKRLEEVSGRSGTTIHRLLGYDGKSFSRNRDNPIDADILVVSEISVSGRRDWYLVDQFTDPMAARSFLLDLFQERLDALGFDIIKDVQVLTPTHKGPLGTKELNEELQRLIQRKLWNTEVPPIATGRRAPFLKHDKVIQTRNNYDLNVMNGAIGYVIDVLANGTLVIDFDGLPVEIEKGSSDLQDLQLAYVLTIHKTQGSEFPCAVVVVHKAHSFMHHRNLLYTGVTRARRTTIVLGDHWGIQNCAKRCQVDDRRTFLPLFLDAAQHAGAE